MPTNSNKTVNRAARLDAARAGVLVFIGSAGMQVSAALAIGLFASIGTIGVSSLRLAIAAIILLLIFRPKIGGRTKSQWASIVSYGTIMAFMNIFIYLALERIPLGVVTTIDFLGPAVVALIFSRHLKEAILAVIAFAGVALIAGFGGPFDTLGLIYAGLAAVCFGAYTILAVRVGRSTSSMGDLVFAVCFAAIITSPFSILAAPSLNLSAIGILIISAVTGTALAFTVDTRAGKLASARIIGVFFAFDPLLGTIIGRVWLGQELTTTALIGITVVIVAGAGVVWSAGKKV